MPYLHNVSNGPSSLNEDETEPLMNHKSHCCVDMSHVIFAVGDSQEQIQSKRWSVKSKSAVLGSIITDACVNGKHHELIELPEVQPEHFRNFLKYVEDENFTLNEGTFTVEEVVEVFKLAKRYSVSALPQHCRQYLERVRSVHNAVLIYQCAQQVDETQLEQETCNFIIKRFSDIVHSKDFIHLTLSNLTTFLKMDEIVVSEIDLFRGICRWGESECSRQSLEASPSNIRFALRNALFLIRFPLISLSDFSDHVAPQEILTCDEVDEITSYLLRSDSERKYESSPFFNNRRRGIIPPKTYSACFFDCVIYNSEVWIGNWKYNLIKVNRPIAIVGFVFDGPIKDDATFYVKIKLAVHEEEDRSRNEQDLPVKDDIVHAKRQRPFFVKFDNPVFLKPDVLYRACYALQGPKTIWGVQPKNQVQMFCDDAGNVVFTYKCVDGQMPELKFTIPS